MAKGTSSALGSVLVVGGCGFVGGHIVRRLLERNDGTEIAVMGRNVDRNRQPGVNYVTGDITSDTSVREVLEKVKPRVIFNTACPISFPTSGGPDFHHKINVEGTTNLVRNGAMNPYTAAFIYTSSASLVAKPEYTNATEEDPILTVDPNGYKYYNTTKAIADNVTRRANNTLPANKGGLRTATIRPGSIFGEGDNQLLPSILKQLDDGLTKFQLGSNDKSYDFVYVGNVADAQILAAEALVKESETGISPYAKGQVGGESYIITNDDPRPFYDFMKQCWVHAGYDLSKHSPWVVPTWAALALGSFSEWFVWFATLGRKKAQQLSRESVEYLCLNKTYDMSKAKATLGYRPRVNVDEGIRRGVASILERKTTPKKDK